MTLSPRLRKVLVVAAPLASIATLMVGMRIGAGETVRAASVFAAPPGMRASPAAGTPFALQVLTYLEDRGVRETVSIPDLTVVARSKGQEARWRGSSNVDGVAEATFELAGLEPNDPVELEVRTASEKDPLASGTIEWPSPSVWGRPPRDPERTSSLRPTRREGAIAIEPFVEGGRLVVGFETSIWLHLTAPALEAARAEVRVAPEVGLRVDRPEPKVACDGWAEAEAVAYGQIATTIITATERPSHTGASTKEARTGTWSGAFPVAAGAFFVEAPRFVPSAEPSVASLVAPNPRTVVYVEVDDERGRVHAAALTLTATSEAPVPRAKFEMPPLADGLHWIVVSGEPRGAEHLVGPAIAKPFLVGGAPAVLPDEACSIGPWLARRSAAGFPRSLALDGMATRGAANRGRHALGLVVGLVSLVTAALLEVFLLTSAARAAAAAMEVADLDDGPHERRAMTTKTPGGGLVVALLVAVLGFALLAVLMIAKG